MNITSQILYSVHCRFFTAFANLTKICVQVLIRICLQYAVKPKQTKYLLAVFFFKGLHNTRVGHLDKLVARRHFYSLAPPPAHVPYAKLDKCFQRAEENLATL
ncbi:unnamed protein product [Ixodes persulcatus]